MIICEACQKRREWINRWANLALERAKHLWNKDDGQSNATTTGKLNKRPKRAGTSDNATNASDRATDNGTSPNRSGRAADV